MNGKKKRRIEIIIFLTLTGIFFCLMLWKNKIEYGDRIVVVNSNEFYSNVSRTELVPGVKYEQTFQYGGDRLYSVSIKYDVSEYDENARWRVNLEKDDGTVIQQWQTESRNITNGEIKEYILDTPYNSIDGQNLRLSISLLTEQNSGVYLCGSDENSLLTGTFYVNREEKEGDISITYSEIENVKITIVYGILSAMLISLMLIFLILESGWKKIGNGVTRSIEFLYKRKSHVWKICISYIFVLILAAGFETIFGMVKNGGNIADSFLLVRYLFFVCIGWSILTVYLERKFLKKQPEIVVCSVLLLIGTLYVLTIQAEAEISWDESIHFWRAVGLSHASTGIANQAENYLYWHSGIPFGLPGSFQQLKAIHNNIQNIYDANIGIGANTTVLSAIYMVAYIPAALLLKIGRGLHFPYWFVFKMGTFANLFLYVTLIYFAMKKLKSGKMILAVSASVGSAFFLSTVYSYDTWIIGWFILGMASFIGSMQKDELINKKEMCTIVISSTIALMPKSIYFPLLGIYLFLPRKKFETSVQYRKFMSSVVASMGVLASGVVLGYIWILPLWGVYYVICNMFGIFFEKIGKKKRNIFLAVCTGILAVFAFFVASYVLPVILGEGDIRGGEGVNAALQVRFILENPFQYAKILLKFLKEYYLSFDASLKNIFNLLGYLGTTGCHMISLIVLVFVTITDKNERDNWCNHKKVRVANVALSFITICMVVTALYISFTPVANASVGGCQPRYLMPMLYGFCATIGTVKIQNKMDKSWYHLGIITVIGGILLYNIWSVVISRFAI